MPLADTDSQLLTRFARNRDEGAFARLVERNAGLVHGAAMRRLADRTLAEEVTQNVFTILARKADRLCHHPRLAAWLQKTAAFESMRAAERESNRTKHMDSFRRELEASPREPEFDPAWRGAAPILDEAMSSALSELEREILLRRYWREEPFKEISRALGKTSGALEKRASRAIDKLSGWFRRRGIALSSGAVLAGLPAILGDASAQAVGELSAGVASNAILAANTSSTSAASGGVILVAMMNTKLLPASLALAALLASASGGWLAGRSSRTSDAVTTTTVSPDEPGTLGQASANVSRADRANHRRLSLRQLLETAHGELLGDVASNVGHMRAAARLSLIEAKDLPAAMELIAEFDGGLHRYSELSALVLERWAVHDGEAACTFALKRMKIPLMGLHPVGDPLRSWASDDPEAAMAWFQKHKTADGQLTAQRFGEWGRISDVRWIMGAWALKDPIGAARTYRRLETQAERQGACVGFMELAKRAVDRRVLLEAIWETPNELGGSSDLSSVLDQWASHRPAELAAWIDSKEIKKSNEFTMSKAVLGNWLIEDRDLAIAWWLERESGFPALDHRLGSLIDAWSEVDVFSAAEWLAQEELTNAHARAVQSLSQSLTREDPERAFAWGLAVPSESLRKRALRHAYLAWVKKEPEAARAALNAADVEESFRVGLEQAAEEDAEPTLQWING